MGFQKITKFLISMGHQTIGLKGWDSKDSKWNPYIHTGLTRKSFNLSFE